MSLQWSGFHSEAKQKGGNTWITYETTTSIGTNTCSNNGWIRHSISGCSDCAKNEEHKASKLLPFPFILFHYRRNLITSMELCQCSQLTLERTAASKEPLLLVGFLSWIIAGLRTSLGLAQGFTFPGTFSWARFWVWTSKGIPMLVWASLGTEQALRINTALALVGGSDEATFTVVGSFSPFLEAQGCPSWAGFELDISLGGRSSTSLKKVKRILVDRSSVKAVNQDSRKDLVTEATRNFHLVMKSR